MSNEPTPAEIMTAIRSSGYLLEQEVATVLEGHGFHVETNSAFEDQDESKSREIDVLGRKQIYEGEKGSFGVYAEVICECKNNSAPFIFIQRPKNRADRAPEPSEYLFPIEEYHELLSVVGGTKTYRRIPAFIHLNLSQSHYYYAGDDKIVQFCRMVRKGSGWEANHAGIYDSIFVPLVKAFLARRGEIRVFQHNQHFTWLFFPMVVLSGKMYRINSSNASPEPEEVDNVTFIRELKSKTINGTFAVDFVTRSGLEAFLVNKLSSFVERTASVVKNERERLLKHEVHQS